MGGRPKYEASPPLANVCKLVPPAFMDQVPPDVAIFIFFERNRSKERKYIEKRIIVKVVDRCTGWPVDTRLYYAQVEGHLNVRCLPPESVLTISSRCMLWRGRNVCHFVCLVTGLISASPPNKWKTDYSRQAMVHGRVDVVVREMSSSLVYPSYGFSHGVRRFCSHL